MSHFQVRTDLVLEARESITEGKEELHGVKVAEYELSENNIHITKVMIESKNAAKTMGKPIGTYITIEAPELLEADEDYHREISKCLADENTNRTHGNIVICKRTLLFGCRRFVPGM